MSVAKDISIEKVFDFVVNAFRAWKGFRLLAFGTTGVGKTTLWKYLETGTLVNASTIESTLAPTPVGDGKFKLRNIKLSGINVRVRAIDVPGNVEHRNTWQEVIKTTKPHGIIFMMDHVKDPNKTPEKGYDENRLQEHYDAFKYLRTLVLDNDEIRENLHALLILVNKSDVFPKNLMYGDIIEYSKINTLYDRLQEIPKLMMKARPCSALYGTNVQEEMAWMVKNLT
jgi:hypothetical protein